MDIVYPTDRQQWNDFVAQSPYFSLMQSFEWGEFKERLGWKVVRVAAMVQNNIVAGAQMLVQSSPLDLASIAYIPRGPLLDWTDDQATTMLLAALHNLARQHRAIFLRIEPPVLHSAEAHQSLQDRGFQATTQTNQPRATLILNLEDDTEAIFAALPKKTRYHIRSGWRKGIEPREGNETDLPTFYRLMQMTGQRAGFSVHSPEYYQATLNIFGQHNYAALFLADYQGETIGAEIPAVFGPHGAALYGVSGNNYRHLPVSDVLTWAGLKWAKAQGCRTYDLWGIPDEAGELATAGKPIPKDKKGGLWGVYYFKKGFGGEIVYYVGTYDYVYASPLLYTAASKSVAWLGSSNSLISFVERLSRS